jgi:ribonuclease BN (tRNA processing enzyme)
MKFFFTLVILSQLLFAQKVELEVLGSGGPEIDGRASTSYLLWVDNQAKLIVDMGSGSMLRFEIENARLEDLEAVVITHMHIDHSVDLPAFVKAGYFSKRSQSLDIIGSFGSDSFPSISEFLVGLFGENGVYRYMSDVLSPQSDSFQIIPVEINSDTIITKKYPSFTLELINTHHGYIPALALAILVDGKKIVISGDTNNKDKHLELLAKDADLFIAHHAVPEHTNKFAKKLHMTPSIIANVAQVAKVKKVVLTHRMNRTLANEKESLEIIKRVYKGEVILAEDRMKIEL